MQRVFSFSFDDSYSFEQFIPGDNTEQIAILRQSFTGAGQKPQQAYISGVSGSGCSHLLQALCQETIANGRKAASLSAVTDTTHIEDVTDHIEQLDLLAIDDLEAVQNNRELEYSLFNLFNHALQSDCSLIFAADQPANRLDLTLPDLQTRLVSCLLIQIHPLAGDDLQLYLRRLFQVRRITVEDTIINYILSRYNRSCSYLRQAVTRLEQESLRQHKPITRALIRSCLATA